MNLDLEIQLRDSGVSCSRLSKSEKVHILARWTKRFQELSAAARRNLESPNVLLDKHAEQSYNALQDEEFFVLPDDPSGMPSYLCRAGQMPDLTELVSDTITRCDELVIVAADFDWSAVLVNFGSPQRLGRFFQDHRASPAKEDDPQH